MTDDHCHEDMGSDPSCGKPPVGYRLDPEFGDPYPVCRRHLREPYWLEARSRLRAARLALAACADAREERRKAAERCP
jgi:hypothetical protein